MSDTTCPMPCGGDAWEPVVGWYRKRPVAVQAEQFRPSDKGLPMGVRRSLDSPTGYACETLEGWAAVKPGDFIITGVRGERYPCREDIFRETYEPAATTGVTTPESGCPGCLRSELNGGKCAGACPGELFVTYDPEQEDEI